VISPYLTYLTFHLALFRLIYTFQSLQNIPQIYSPLYSIFIESLLTLNQLLPFPSSNPPIHRHSQLISSLLIPFLASTHSLYSLRYSLFLRNGIFSHLLHSLISSIFLHFHNPSSSNLNMKPSTIHLRTSTKLPKLQLTPATDYLLVKLLLHSLILTQQFLTFSSISHSPYQLIPQIISSHLLLA